MPVKVAAGVVVRLPGAVSGAAMTVTVITLLGPTWGQRSGSAGMLAD